MKFRRIIATVCAAMLLTVGLQVVTGTAAHALPSDCTIYASNGTNAQSLCTSGTGQHRIVVYWSNPNPFTPMSMTDYGPWTPVGSNSTVSHGCCALYRWIELRN